LPLVGFIGGLVVVVSISRWSRRVRVAVVSTAVLALATRTVVRNADWRSNLALWASAIRVSPRSFRARRSLAWSMFRADPDLDHFEPIIAEAEAATSLLGRLPLIDRDALSYLQVAVLARTRAERLPRDDGTAVREARLLYRRAARALAQARTIDRLQNARHRG